MSWLYAKPAWAGLSIVIMWLVVLFVGLFGGDIVSSTPGGTSTSVPVVVVVLPFVLPATIVVARRGFKDTPGEAHGGAGAERGAAEQPAGEAPALHSKAA